MIINEVINTDNTMHAPERKSRAQRSL